MSEVAYQIKLDVFEGPLDLLLYLIQKDKIDICDIPISHVTEQYLEHIRLLQDLDMEAAGEFLLMAATLIHIKSKMLLPTTKEGKAEEPDPRSELVQQLSEHKKFKAAAEMLLLRSVVQQEVFTRASLENDEKNTEVAATVIDLIEAFKRVLDRRKTSPVIEIALEEMSLEQKIEQIKTMFVSTDRVNLTQLFDACSSKRELVVTLLAVLELAKEDVIALLQEVHFGVIYALKR
ncbi:MAG: segregation/condensation protein A [Acidobacteriota bacterium]|nr:segregation/condensation protein A [Blastocatellia bacterium]MDW8412458.1 segregation/condensation protein A [Acidobacteriota bacterium]